MPRNLLRLSDDEILQRLLSRRDLTRLGAMAAAVAAPVLLGATRHGPGALAQEVVGTPAGDDEASMYKPTVTVGSPQPEVTGPAATPAGAALGEATPMADVSIDAFMDLSQALVGGGTLDASRGAQLLALLAADPARRTAIDQLLEVRADADVATPIATPVAALSEDARSLVETILRFWYLGTYDDQPVEGRADFWFGLSAWQAVKYTYAPSVCRAFGIWAEPPTVQ
jgi:hypothetical protein